jgi:hypothetical protein
MNAYCWLFGHKPLELKVLAGRFIEVKDALGVKLLDVHLCERCKYLYWIAADGSGDANG